VLRAKAGSQVLATHRTESNTYGRIPLLVTRTFGTGKVLLLATDGAWRWREGVEDKYHYRFWGQVARWMAYQRNMAQGEAMRLFYSPDRPQADDIVTLYANVMGGDGEPLQEGNVKVQITSPSGGTEEVHLAARSEQWGLFQGTFTPREAGQYELTLVCSETSDSLSTHVAVHGLERERMGEPMRPDVMEEIATLTGGKLLQSDRLQSLLDEVARLPQPAPTVRRMRIWCHPAWAGLLLVLMASFWTARKLTGTI
jgi:hypothetical protein